MQAYENISRAAGEIENRLLKEFEEAYSARYFDRMRLAAKPLLDFEGFDHNTRVSCLISIGLRL